MVRASGDHLSLGVEGSGFGDKGVGVGPRLWQNPTQHLAKSKSVLQQL